MKTTISFGSEKTVITGADGKTLVIRHNPPRDHRAVLRDYARLIATREGRLNPREPFHDGIGDGRPVDPTAELTGVFIDAMGRTRPITALIGSSMASIIAGLPFGDISAFSAALYREAYETLATEGRLGQNVSDYELRAMLLETVRQILPGFRQRWRQAVDTQAADLIGTVEKVRPRQLLLPLQGGESMSVPDCSDSPNVLGRPLVQVEAGAASESSTTTARPSRQPRTNATARKRTVAGEAGPGTYLDYCNVRRSVPVLNPHTIHGVLSQDGVLDSGRTFTADDFLRIASTASQHRRNKGYGGGNIAPQTAEFIVRVFRALAVTSELVASSGSARLSAQYAGYVTAKRS